MRLLEVAFTHQFLDAFDRIAFVIKKAANMPDKFNIFGTIVAPTSAAFDGANLRELGFPKSENVSR